MPIKKQIGNSKQFKETIKCLKPQDWQKLKESIDSFRDKVIITLLYSTGCRVSEIAKMKIEHLDLENNFIRIPAENTKTKQARTVRIGKEIASDLNSYLKLQKATKGFLFISRQSGQITDRRIRQLIHHYATKAGLQAVYTYDKTGKALYEVTPHTLRHTHIVHALLNKVPIAAVQKQVGHKRLTTTQIYSDLAPEQVRDAYGKFE